MPIINFKVPSSSLVPFHTVNEYKYSLEPKKSEIKRLKNIYTKFTKRLAFCRILYVRKYLKIQEIIVQFLGKE